MVLLLQVGEHYNKCKPVVSNNLAKCAPSAQDVFEDPIADGLHGLCMEGTVFREMPQGATPLYEVLEAG